MPITADLPSPRTRTAPTPTPAPRTSTLTILLQQAGATARLSLSPRDTALRIETGRAFLLPRELRHEENAQLLDACSMIEKILKRVLRREEG